VIGILFFELNGCRFSASEQTSAQAMIYLAGGRLNAAQYAAFVRASSKPAKSG
jgi:prophage maintenance system killer protein